jgi:hypothetical protein
MLEENKGFHKKGRSNNVANENLIATKNIGEMSLRASFIIAKVTPQKKVIVKRAISPMYLFMGAI